MDMTDPLATRPKSVAYVAMGGSRAAFENMLMRDYRKGKDYDEVWAGNSLGMMLDEAHYDKLWMMDDLRGDYVALNEKKKEAGPWFDPEVMAGKKKPIITSTAYPEYPSSVAYPLKFVLGKAGCSYIPNTTTCYAIAYAVATQVENLHLFGTDFEPGIDKDFEDQLRAHDLECFVRGKTAVVHWLGVAIGHGMNVYIPDNSNLLGAVQFSVKEKGVPYGYSPNFDFQKLLKEMQEEQTNVNE